MRALVVEDHATLAGRIAQGLRQAGMAVDAGRLGGVLRALLLYRRAAPITYRGVALLLSAKSSRPADASDHAGA
ncbi:MAG TPA: hypothetical protein VGK33_03650, partial [Chloroflexota bacterium]